MKDPTPVTDGPNPLRRAAHALAIALLALAACADEPDPAVDAAAIEAPAVEPGEPPIDPVAGRCSFLSASAPRCCFLACENADAFRAECSPPSGTCTDFACPLRAGGFEEPSPMLCLE